MVNHAGADDMHKTRSQTRQTHAAMTLFLLSLVPLAIALAISNLHSIHYVLSLVSFSVMFYAALGLMAKVTRELDRAELVLPSGQTVYESVRDDVQELYTSGSLRPPAIGSRS